MWFRDHVQTAVVRARIGEGHPTGSVLPESVRITTNKMKRNQRTTYGNYCGQCGKQHHQPLQSRLVGKWSESRLVGDRDVGKTHFGRCWDRRTLRRASGAYGNIIELILVLCDTLTSLLWPCNKRHAIYSDTDTLCNDPTVPAHVDVHARMSMLQRL